VVFVGTTVVIGGHSKKVVKEMWVEVVLRKMQTFEM